MAQLDSKNRQILRLVIMLLIGLGLLADAAG